MAEAKYKAPHVHTALHEILKSLAVDKNGILPGNMGGKPYIAAHDVAAEVKKQFVENDLIFLPTEEVIKQEIVQNGARTSLYMAIRGTYTVISVKDGSTVTFSGTGDGFVAGNSVGANIASTNAFKNALMRFFLITEQSVEDAGKNGVPEGETNRALNQAQPKAVGSQAARPATGGPSAASLKKRIKEEFIDAGKVEKDDVNAAVQTAKASGEHDNDVAVYTAVLEKLSKGEV